MTQDLKFRPGAIVKSRNGNKYFVVMSLPMIAKKGKQIVTALPLALQVQKLKCNKSPHIIVPSNLKTRGLICAHQSQKLSLDNFKYVERIQGHLLEYLKSVA